MILCADCFEDRSDEEFVDTLGTVMQCPACGSTRLSSVDRSTSPSAPEPQPAPAASRLVALGEELCGRCGTMHVIYGVAS